MTDEDIPVLTDAVHTGGKITLSRQQMDELCDSLSAETWVLIDRLIAESLRDMEDTLRVRINEQLGDELPQLIAKALREKLGEQDD